MRVCDCFLNLAIKYSQKTDIITNKFKSDLLKLAEKETETAVMFFSDIVVVSCFDAFFRFTNTGAWYERYNLIVDKTNNDGLHYLEACISIFMILDQPTTYCDNFSNDLTDFESLCTNCQKQYIKYISVKFHCFIKWQKMYILGSENGEKIECSAVVEEKKLNFVPKKIFVIVILISLWNADCKRLIGKIFIMK